MAAGLLALHREGCRHPQRPLAAGTAPWRLRAASCTVAQLAATRGTFTASAFVGTGGTAAQKLGEKPEVPWKVLAVIATPSCINGTAVVLFNITQLIWNKHKWIWYSSFAFALNIEFLSFLNKRGLLILDVVKGEEIFLASTWLKESQEISAELFEKRLQEGFKKAWRRLEGWRNVGNLG